MTERASRTGRVAAALVLAGAGLALVWAVRSAQAPLDGPAPVPWDRVRCERCGMLVGDRAFAGQLHMRDRRVLHFDDPGCLLLYRHEHGPDVATGYLRHLTEDRFIELEAARFVAAEPTPMGYGLGATDDAAADASSAEQALALTLELEQGRRGP